MKVTYYDLLSHIIPGTFIIVFIQLFAIRPTTVHPSLVFTADSILLFTPIIFVIGFLISSLSNLSELLLDKFKCINPEHFMFDEKCAKRFRFYEFRELQKCLKYDIKDSFANYSALRRQAYQSPAKNKLDNYKAKTSFARNILLVFIICLIFSFFPSLVYQNILIKAALIVAIGLSAYRYVWNRVNYIIEIFELNVNIKTTK